MTGSQKSPKPDLERMIVLLDQERRALKQADMPGLVRLAPRKEAILARLEASVPPRAGAEDALVRMVRAKATRNARLFEAALRGLKDARAVIERFRNRSGDQTYGRNGARRLVDPPGGTLQKRA